VKWDFHNVYFSLLLIKSMRMVLLKRVVRKEVQKYRRHFWKTIKRVLRDLEIDGKVILKHI